jgi:hypothetical protein
MERRGRRPQHGHGQEDGRRPNGAPRHALRILCGILETTRLKEKRMPTSKPVTLACAALVFAAAGALQAQTTEKPPATQPPPPQATEAQPASATGPQLTATLVDAAAKAQKQAATVRVTVKGVAIVDPALSKEQPRPGEGHLHYQVDDGPVVATTATKLSFHGLKPGVHRITVVLAANDHTPLGPQQVLEVTIPGGSSM